MTSSFSILLLTTATAALVAPPALFASEYPTPTAAAESRLKAFIYLTRDTGLAGFEEFRLECTEDGSCRYSGLEEHVQGIDKAVPEERVASLVSPFFASLPRDSIRPLSSIPRAAMPMPPEALFSWKIRYGNRYSEGWVVRPNEANASLKSSPRPEIDAALSLEARLNREFKP